jgi:hypothetical protein
VTDLRKVLNTTTDKVVNYKDYYSSAQLLSDTTGMRLRSACAKCKLLKRQQPQSEESQNNNNKHQTSESA